LKTNVAYDVTLISLCYLPASRKTTVKTIWWPVGNNVTYHPTNVMHASNLLYIPFLLSRNTGKIKKTHLKMSVFWDTAPCSLAETDWRFKDAYCSKHFWNVRSISTGLNGAVSQKAVIFIVTTVRTWNLSFTNFIHDTTKEHLHFWKECMWTHYNQYCWTLIISGESFSVPLRSTNISSKLVNPEFPHWNVMDHFTSKLYHR
jgi:hypothetical protein